ncbi:dadD [Cucurbita argyrosperma subsp. argyrosperma]|nr:dadD [Cucurbita argyrosperma subsp. argyrosperma]
MEAAYRQPSEEAMESKSTDFNHLTVLHNAMIVTMDPDSRVFRNGGIAISGDKIKAIGHSSEILLQFSASADHIIDLHSQILLPGFINTHVHTSQQLARSIADDVDLMTWLHHRIWPYESTMTEEDSYVSSLLCGIELIHSELLGLRACLTQSIMDCGEGLPAPWAAVTTDDCIQSQKELYKKHHNTADGRIRVWFGIRQIMNATDRLLIETRDNAIKLETGIHMHVAEIPYENLKVMNERNVDHGTVTYLDKIQFLGNNLLSAHTVWVNDNEISFLSRNGVKVSHCPASAMRMLGFAPIREMLDAVDEMYLASLINKGREVFVNGTTNPSVLPAEVVLQMVTINGAKSADMVVINPSSWSMVPAHDSMRTENVVSVMCNGRWIMKDKKIVNVNEEDVILMAKKACKELVERAGIRIPNRMNFI